MDSRGKATRLALFDLSTPAMRAFHMAWIAFFLCFFAWFGIAPLMHVVRAEMALTRDQVGWCIIGSVAITVVARLVIGWLCDRIGPRLCYTGLLLLGSLPVMGIALAWNFESFLFFRVLIGAIGASFVITQYHTSVMFAPSCVGTANATAAGWGNLGGGVTQMAMPLVFAMFVGFGLSDAQSWRAAMIAAGAVCMVMGVAYYFFTQDTPEGNFRDVRRVGWANGASPAGPPVGNGTDPLRGTERRAGGPAAEAALAHPTQAARRSGGFLEACRDRRVWALFLVYGACFGMELTLDNVAALYFLDSFDELKQAEPMKAMRTAGLIAGCFGAMNLFARAMGGIIGDRLGARWGLSGRVKWLFLAVFCEGICLMLFSQARTLVAAVPALILTGLFVKMANGATYSVVPFINRKALGSVSGIVGAGGNAGAVAAGFLFKTDAISWPTALFLLGALVTVCSFSSFAVTFSAETEEETRAAGARVGLAAT